jgi:hypothetical protein
MTEPQQEELRTPEQWEEDMDSEVVDADGWRADCALGAKNWNVPITLAEYLERAGTSTIGPKGSRYKVVG